LKRVLRLETPARYPSGEFRGSYASLTLTNKPQSPEAEMVTRHEGAHSWLNLRTGYGCVLSLLACLAVDSDYDQLVATSFGPLIAATRITHEVFATWTGVRQSSATPKVLEQYPGYQAYYRIADSIAPEWRAGEVMKDLAVEAMVRVALQNSTLGVAAAIGLDTVARSEADRSDDRPDGRFETLRASVSWSSFHRAFEQRFDALEDTEGEDGTGKRAEARVWTYDWIAEILRKTGAYVYESEGHLSDYETVYAALRDTSRKVAAALPAVVADEPTIQHESVWGHHNERLALHPSLLVEVRTPYEDYVSTVTELPPGEHFFLAARPVRRMLTQYALAGPDASLIRINGDGGISTVLRSSEGVGQSRRVTISPLPDPRVVEMFPSLPAPVLGNVSASALVSGTWKAAWLERLARFTALSVLLDHPPVSAVKRWCEAGCHVRYCVFGSAAGRTLADATYESQHVVFVCRVDGLGFDWPMLTPVSPAFANSLLEFLPRRFPRQVSVDDSLGDPADFAIHQALLHVVLEEPWVDFYGSSDV
jgi:hypothetical protein